MAEYSKRHGGPWDRGSSDSYYRRWFEPHYYEQGTGTSKRVPITDKDSEVYTMPEYLEVGSIHWAAQEVS